MSIHAPRMSERQTPAGTVYLLHCPGCLPDGRQVGKTKNRDKALRWVDYHRAQMARFPAHPPAGAGAPPDPAQVEPDQRPARRLPASRSPSVNSI